MPKTKISIACQGGGSQTAFTAGALKALCEAGITEEFEIVSISGTSGGAVCAALLWFAMETNQTPLWGGLMDFWKDNTAQGWVEETFNKMVVESVRMANAGRMATIQVSPASPMMPAIMGMATMGQRENFKNFRALLETHIDFGQIASWGPQPKRPVLMIGAANITTGHLTKFVSMQEPIRVEHILASCAVPNIFPAVQIGDSAYWDGLFSDNPPVKALIMPAFVGAENMPDEIWLIKINATGCATVPVRPDDIMDRRNELDGNISLFQQLAYLEMLNDMMLARAFRPEYLAQFDVKAPIRIPKSFPSDADKPYHIPLIEMSQEMMDTLDYESKIDRSAANINRLIAEGERSARAFLENRAKIIAAG